MKQNSYEKIYKFVRTKIIVRKNSAELLRTNSAIEFFPDEWLTRENSSIFTAENLAETKHSDEMRKKYSNY